ncbi:hypothetical protein GCM10011611_61100 [Aliidongia dinghuensis]|uniref:SpoVG family protein n=1 Tax=Aliidongia dinghuensis TaxID=1867774 RepID=A0A8J2Z105_9PROT|nr:hypothetical protein [Aliidongia dinghuensis]GGF46423.1 hypothetical protein GCM10011611_61100 [Aliidongia dinghuensis]
MSGRDLATQTVNFTIGNCTPMQSKSVFAFVDVEIVICGVGFWIRGVQARHVAGGGTSIHLPTYRAPDGTWRAAVELPEDLVAPMADAVLAYLVDEGVAVRKTA